MNNAIVLDGIAFAIAGLTALAITPLVRALSAHVGMVDHVDERRMHAVPTPRIGGVAVYLGFAFALFAVLGVALPYLPFFHDVGDIHSLLGLLFGGTLILGVGIWDDVMGMRPRYKLAAQSVVAIISMAYGFIIPWVGNPFTHSIVFFPWWIGIPLTLVWYLGMMNAINFIDGLDGLLAGVATIAGFYLFIIALGHQHVVVALVVIALAGATAGFLPYNFNPAKIFLGDSGSLFIGYVFATVSIMGVSKIALSIGLLVPLILLALPIADTAAAIFRRARSGRKISEADRAHFHHQLIFRFGLNVRQAVLLIYAVCFVLGALAFWWSGGLHTLPRLAGV